MKTKGESKGEANGRGTASSEVSVQLDKQVSQQIGKLEIKTRNEDENYGDGSSMHHYSDSDSVQSTSPTSHASSVSGSNDSGPNFTASSSSSSGSSTNGSFSGNMSEEEEEEEEVDDDCLDDWETVADALAATDEKQKERSTDTAPSKNHSAGSGFEVDTGDQICSRVSISSDNRDSGRISDQRVLVNCCAWRPDDACRPQSLPNLTKQYSFPLKSERRLERGSVVWACKNAGPNPTSCPICFEDLDTTDSSFLPCTCGFRLCLFCHKRILEEDGRCPGCRKQYDVEAIEGEATIDGGSLTYRLARSCSMVTRS